MNCTDRNGDVITYLVQFVEVWSGTAQRWNVSGGRYITIQYLMSSTTYAIEVAAVNRAGVGEYSHPVIVITRESKYIYSYICG